MGLHKYRLGELIEQVFRQNTKLDYGVDDVRGVSNTKGMIATKADMSSRSLAPFYIIEPGEFVFNRRTTRNGERLGMAFNDTDRAYIFTNDYVAFRVRESARGILSAEYLYMFFCRDEFDRYVRVHSWGSATEFFNWDDMCAVEIELPPLDVQQKYVAVYRAIFANQQSYERGREDLKTVIDATLDSIKKEEHVASLRTYLTDIDRRNSSGRLKKIYGVNLKKTFMPSVAKVAEKSLLSYKVVQHGELACNPMHTGRDGGLPVALNFSDEDVLVSSAYFVFRVDDSILSEYVLMWLSREQVDRKIAFFSDGTVRGGIAEDTLLNLGIAVPSQEKQRALANLYSVYRKRQQLAERLKSQLAHLCPILIRGAMDEAARA